MSSGWKALWRNDYDDDDDDDLSSDGENARGNVSEGTQRHRGGSNHNDDDKDNEEFLEEEEIMLPWTYRECRTKQKELLQAYMKCRILPLEEEDEEALLDEHEKENAATVKSRKNDDHHHHNDASLGGGKRKAMEPEEENDDDDSDEDMLETQQQAFLLRSDDQRNNYGYNNSHQNSGSSPRQEKMRALSSRPLPHVDHTIRTVHRLAEMDLSSRIVHLPLLRIDRYSRVWSTTTSTCANNNNNNNNKACPALDIAWQHQVQHIILEDNHHANNDNDNRNNDDDVPHPFHFKQPERLLTLLQCREPDDLGPLMSVYRSVLVVHATEVQLDRHHHHRHDDGMDDDDNEYDAEEGEGRTTTEQLHYHRAEAAILGVSSPHVRRVRIFFYGEYATLIESVLKRAHRHEAAAAAKKKKATSAALSQQSQQHQQQQHHVLLQLESVPAQCVFPYAKRKVDSSFDETHNGDWSSYSLCIGDTSKFCVMVPLPQEDSSSLPPPHDALSQQQPEPRKERVRFDKVGLCIRVRVDNEDNGDDHNDREEDDDDVEWEIACLPPRENGDTPLLETTMRQATYVEAGEGNDESVSRATRASNDSGIAQVNHHEKTNKEKGRGMPLSTTDANQLQQQQSTTQEAAPNARENNNNILIATTTMTTASVAKEGPPVVREQPTLRMPRPRRKRQRTGQKQQQQAGVVDADPDVDYLKLNDLAARYESHADLQTTALTREACWVDVYGVVLSFSAPSQTKKSDFSMSVTLVDESLPLPAVNLENGAQGHMGASLRTIPLVIFCNKVEDLPSLRHAGDILRIHRAKLQTWNGDVQLMGWRASSFVVFRGDPANHQSSEICEIHPTAKHEFSLTNNDRERFWSLWRWGQRRLLTHPTMSSAHCCRLHDMRRPDDEYSEEWHAPVERDLTVMVAAIHPVPNPNGITPRGFLRVWDGTGPPLSDPLPSFIDTPEIRLNKQRHGEPPSSALVKLAHASDLIRGIGGQNRNGETAASSSSRWALARPTTLTGRVANVAVYDDCIWNLMQQTAEVGTFVRLRNVRDSRLTHGDDNRTRCLCAYGKSHITPLPMLTYEVIELLRQHQIRLQQRDSTNPSSGILPLNVNPLSEATVANAMALENTLPGQLTEPARETNAAQQTTLRRRKQGVPVQRLSKLVSRPIPTKFVGYVRILGTLPSLRALSEQGGARMGEVCRGKRLFAIQIVDKDNTNAPTRIDAVVQPGSDTAKVLLSRHRDQQKAKDALGYVREYVKQGRSWKMTLRSVDVDGCKYFYVDSAMKDGW